MRLIPDEPNEVERLQAERLAEGLRQTMESTVMGSMPLIPEPPGGRQVGADRIGVPESVIPKESAEAERGRELAQSKQAAHDAAVESARLRGRLEGLREGERRPAA